MLTSDPKLAAELDRDLIGLLTTVNANGQPQTSPIWFLREGEDVVIYSEPSTGKLRNIAANPRVALALRGDEEGDTVYTLQGAASVDTSLVPADRDPAYLAKYRGQIERLGWTPAVFATRYSVGIRIVVDRVR
jgi:PPOX class probable F420-dependent enzyme